MHAKTFPVRSFSVPTSMLTKFANSFVKLPFASKFYSTIRASGEFYQIAYRKKQIEPSFDLLLHENWKNSCKIIYSRRLARSLYMLVELEEQPRLLSVKNSFYPSSIISINGCLSKFCHLSVIFSYKTDWSLV